MDASSSSGLSFLDPSTMQNSPINKDGIRSVSTPVRQYDNNEKLSPIDLTGILEGHTRTPVTKHSKEIEAASSILGRSSRKGLGSSFKGDVTGPSIERHSESKSASRHGDTKTARDSRVSFSPKKDLISSKRYYEQESEGSRYADRSFLRGSRKVNEDMKEVSSSASGSEKNEDKDPYHLSETNEGAPIARLLTDPNIPYVLSLYLQLFFNLLLISIILYFVFVFIKTIRSDIRHKIEIYTTDALQEISMCTREYYRNKCSTEDGNRRAPALESSCVTWGKCMNRDPQLIGKSKITAETFADILNGFIRPISWKSLIFINFIVFGSLLITNVAFGSYRHSSKIDKAQAEEASFMRSQLNSQKAVIEKYQMLENRLNEIDSASINTSFKRLTNGPVSARAGRVNHIHDLDTQDVPESANSNLSFSSPLVNKRR